jgi:hypothetical protein
MPQAVRSLNASALGELNAQVSRRRTRARGNDLARRILDANAPAIQYAHETRDDQSLARDPMDRRRMCV